MIMDYKRNAKEEIETINNCLFCNSIGAITDLQMLENIEARLKVLLYKTKAEIENTKELSQEDFTSALAELIEAHDNGEI